MRAALLLLFLTGCSGCAHASIAGPDPNCIETTPPRTFVCSFDGRPIVEGVTVMMCHYGDGEGVPRWVVYNLAGDSMTLVGATCNTVLEGAH